MKLSLASILLSIGLSSSAYAHLLNPGDILYRCGTADGKTFELRRSVGEGLVTISFGGFSKQAKIFEGGSYQDISFQTYYGMSFMTSDGERAYAKLTLNSEYFPKHLKLSGSFPAIDSSCTVRNVDWNNAHEYPVNLDTLIGEIY